MAHFPVTADSTHTAGIAEPHQSAVAAILLGVGQGLLTAAEADLSIDRLRMHDSATRRATAVL